MSNKILDIDKSLNFMKRLLENNNLYNIYKYEFEYIVYKQLFIYSLLKYDKLNSIHRAIYRIWKKENKYKRK